MNSRNGYSSWLQKRRNVEISTQFAHVVMKQVSLHEQQQRTANPELKMFQCWLERMAHHPVVKVALLVVALAAGAARLLATWQIILSF
jgi:hypothetical protein